MDRATNSGIRSTAAEIRDATVNFTVGWVGHFVEERRYCHDEARLTVTTLRDLFAYPSPLDHVQGTVANAFDSRHPLAFGFRHGHDA